MWTTRFYCSLGASTFITLTAAFLKLYEVPAWMCNLALGIGIGLVILSFPLAYLSLTREAPAPKKNGNDAR